LAYTSGINVQNPDHNCLHQDPKRFDIVKVDVELPRLRATIDKLLHGGRLKNDTKLVHNLLVFADMMGETLAVAKAVPKPLK